MTKEENIATLNEHLDHWKRLLSEKICDQDEGEKTIDALQNAIKALEQQPTDAVDRVTIKEYLDSFGAAYELGKEKGLDIELDILGKYTEEGNEKIIRDLPSETPQPKMGRWIEHFDESGKWYECDQCHTDWGGYVNYCPNCGAKMQEVNDERTVHE